MSPPVRTIGPARMLGFAVGSIGSGVYATVPGVLLLYFATQILLLPAALASLAILAPKLVVILTDPAIGIWSDRTRTSQGRRRPFLIAGAVLSAITFALLFHLRPLPSQAATLALLSGAYLLTSLSYSLFAVPYVSMPAELSDDAAVRVRLIAWRMMFVFAGVLLGAAAPPVMVEALGGGQVGYGRMAIVVAAIALTSMAATVWAAPRDQPAPAPAAAGSIGRALGDRNFVVAMAVYASTMIAIGAKSAASPYFVTVALGRPVTDLSQIMLVQVTLALIAMPAWSAAAQRLPVRRCYLAALAIVVASCVVFFLAPASDPMAWVLAAATVAGVGHAGIQVAGFAMLADATRHANDRSGLRQEGLLTGMWTASEKVALALGPVVCGSLLAAGGFISGAAAGAQPATAVDAARAAMTLAPIALIVLSSLVLVLSGRKPSARPVATV